MMTNEAKVHGATTMMYKDAVKVLAEKIGGDFYLIPSSIHEVMAIPEGTLDPKKLILMLEEGNRTCCAGKRDSFQYDLPLQREKRLFFHGGVLLHKGRNGHITKESFLQAGTF